jgi:hypothetical protein
MHQLHTLLNQRNGSRIGLRCPRGQPVHEADEIHERQGHNRWRSLDAASRDSGASRFHRARSSTTAQT